MNKIALRPGGLKVSRLVSGLWRLNDSKDILGNRLNLLEKRIEGCIEVGITTFDHADIYGDYSCQESFGSRLHRSPHLRDQMEIITKAGVNLLSEKFPARKVKHYNLSQNHLTTSLETSLKELRTDWVDLFLLHRPDPLMNVDETAATLDLLVEQGKTRYVGVSNFLPTQIDLLQSRMKTPLMTNQVELSALNPEGFIDGTLDYCQRQQLKLMAWSPMAGGQLFQKESKKQQKVHNALSHLAQKYSIEISQAALSWLLYHPAEIIPVIGSNNLERITKAAEALAISLSREDWYLVWEASQGEVP